MLSKNQEVWRKCILKVLLVSGDGFAALNIEQEIGIEKAAKMTIENGGELEIYGDHYYALLRILEFGEVDPKFIDFVINEIQDYTKAKDKTFYVIE